MNLVEWFSIARMREKKTIHKNDHVHLSHAPFLPTLFIIVFLFSLLDSLFFCCFLCSPNWFATIFLALVAVHSFINIVFAFANQWRLVDTMLLLLAICFHALFQSITFIAVYALLYFRNDAHFTQRIFLFALANEFQWLQFLLRSQSMLNAAHDSTPFSRGNYSRCSSFFPLSVSVYVALESAIEKAYSKLIQIQFKIYYIETDGFRTRYHWRKSEKGTKNKRKCEQNTTSTLKIERLGSNTNWNNPIWHERKTIMTISLAAPETKTVERHKYSQTMHINRWAMSLGVTFRKHQLQRKLLTQQPDGCR